MKRLESPEAVEKFRALILGRLGLQFEDSKLGFLGEVIQHRLDETGLDPAAYLYLLEFGGADNELAPLAKELTVPETYFFRNIDQFNALREVVIPTRMEARGQTHKLNILSAGCATGEEAYSLAMLVMELHLDPSWQVSVRAIDINPMVLKKARRGLYSSWAFRETAPEFQKKWFRPDGRDFAVIDSVRDAVSFQECNLAADNPEIWQPESYDVIFCRNVLMYFSPEQARKVMARISKALAPGGYFFFGHAETLRGLSEDFHLRHTHNAFYYQKKNSDEEVLPLGQISMPTPPAMDAPPVSEDWIQSIHRASERVQALSTDSPKAGATRATTSKPPRKSLDMSPVFALLHGDRFSDALAYVKEMPKEAGSDPDVLLVEAMLLAHSGKTAEAESVCQRLLQVDEMNASAHHVLALCRETATDLDAAMEQDRIAAYLDPAFAMPHLHMGLMARRLGNRDLARRELAQALMLLRHEDSARLLLFGGGFNRQSMIDLCTSALRDCGGTL